jgi:flagellar hook-basal body complex protein FliE
MSISAISAVGVGSPVIEVAGMSSPVEPRSSTFATLMDQAASLNQRMQVDDNALQSLALGNGDQLHRVLMNLERTRLSFELMLQVRSKLLDAYQELMRQQV